MHLGSWVRLFLLFSKFGQKCAENPSEEQVERRLGLAHILYVTCAFRPAFHNVSATEREEILDTPSCTVITVQLRIIDHIRDGPGSGALGFTCLPRGEDPTPSKDMVAS